MVNYIEYFKALVEKKSDAEEWATWFARHESELSKVLTPGSLLRLRMYPLTEVYQILKAQGFEYPKPETYAHAKFHVAHPIPVAWLQVKVFTSEVEKQFVKDRSSLQIVQDRMQPGDEWWSFQSPSKTWKHKMGRAGFAVVRDGVPIDCVITLMN